MEYFLNDKGTVIVFEIIKAIQENKEYLSDIDGAIGDGDHGINMSKGFTICMNRLKGDEGLSSALNILGKVLLMEVGGSMGPLYGTFFMEMSKSIKGKDIIDKNSFAEMLESSVKGIQSLSNAGIGDKTLMDTLIPATEAFRAAVENGSSFRQGLHELVTAAEIGKESTRDMVAKIGRASRLGERSRGVLDAGATSCNLILKSMALATESLLQD
jgi:dihydroxyacetone kinase-like protein